VLVLLRHGESAWNAANVFTGWIDVELSEQGEKQAQRAGALLAASGHRHQALRCRTRFHCVTSSNPGT